MTFRKIPVNVPFWSNVEDESKVNVADQRNDVIKDLAGTTIRRPGLAIFGDELSQSVDGWFYWEHTDLVYIVSGTNLYSLTQNGTVTLISSGVFTAGKNVTFAESGDFSLITAGATRKIFITNGGRVVVYNGAATSTLNGANDPVQSSHVVMFDTYLLSNELSNTQYDESVLRSKVADPITFEGAFFSAESHPDKLTALHTEWDELALFGQRSIENFYNDKTTPLTAIPGATIADGTRSPWTIKLIDNAYLFMNKARRLIRIDGRQPIVVSQPIDNILNDEPDYENAEGEKITLKGKTLYLLTINDRTLVYDYSINEWVGEWTFWNKTRAKYQAFKARNFINIEPWNMTLCTDKGNGKLYKLDFETYQDYGNEIRSSVITGNIDHGTSREKRSNELKIKLKRGKKVKTLDADVEPKMLLRWKDNGSGVWSNYRDIPLGFQGDNIFYYSLFMLGTYRSRQYEFVCTDNVPFSIVEVNEDVELLR
jgi:hypothetical protein